MQTRLMIAGAVLAGLLAPAACSPRGDAPQPAGGAPARPAGTAPVTAKTDTVKYTDLDGKSFTIADVPGQVKVVNYWATWCQPCIKEIPSFNKLHAEYGPKGVTVIGVSIDENGAEDVAPFLKTPKGRMDYRVALAKLEDLAPVGVTESIPVTLVYDASGRLLKRFDGYAEEAALEAAVNDALGAPKG